VAIVQAAHAPNEEAVPEAPPQGEPAELLDLANEADAVQPTEDSDWAEHSLGSVRDRCSERDLSHGTT
jgi:hypothetical protein